MELDSGHPSVCQAVAAVAFQDSTTTKIEDVDQHFVVLEDAAIEPLLS